MSAVCMEWFLVTDFFMFYFLHLAASETPEKVPLFRSGLNAWKKMSLHQRIHKPPALDTPWNVNILPDARAKSNGY